MSVAAEQFSHPTIRAVEGVREQLSDVAEVPLWSLRDGEVEQLLTEAHRAAAQLSELVSRVTAEAGRRNLSGKAGAPNPRAWLRHHLRISPAGAKTPAAAGHPPRHWLRGDARGAGGRAHRR